jgi:hypothetical protein
MSTEQDFGYDEVCENCHDPLEAERNWSVTDIRNSMQYCTKPECQAVKPAVIKNQMTGKSAKANREIDKGLSHQLKEQTRFVKIRPDQDKVDEWAKIISDPQMVNAKGWPKYSKIFPAYGINNWEKGYTSTAMAVGQFPDEVDMNGCPSKASVASVRRYLKSLTRRFDGNLEIYSSQGRNPNPPYRREWRYYVLKDKKDLDSQVGGMRDIANNIALAAAKRERNFGDRTYEQRMEKVELLDKFFEK